MIRLHDIVTWGQSPIVVKIVTVLAAPGGIWFWIDKYRSRTRIEIRNLDFPIGDGTLRRVAFEAENVGDKLTSLQPTFTLTGYNPERQQEKYTFALEGEDRQLPPYVRKRVSAIHNNHGNRVIYFLWFLSFRIPLTRGPTIRVRCRNVDGFVRLRLLRFNFERVMYILFGRLRS